MNDKILYSDSVIEIKLQIEKDNESLKSIALRYLEPMNYKDKGGAGIVVTNNMGGETDWFILPHTFGAVVGRKLFEQYNAGLCGFDKNEIESLKNWLIELEIIDDAMCY